MSKYTHISILYGIGFDVPALQRASAASQPGEQAGIDR